MHIRIATWNVERPTVNGWKSPKRNPIINQQLHEINADIWILTETHRVITPGDEYESLSTDKAKFHREGETRATIWSRLPILTPLNTFDPAVAVCAEIKTPAGRLIVYGSIITWAHNKGSDGKSKMWAEHYKSIQAHGDDWAKLSQNGAALCAAGDFNETLNRSGWYGTKKGRELLRQALDRSHLDCLTQDYRVDHICTTKEWAKKAEVHQWAAPPFNGKPVSDHGGYHVDLYFDT